MKKNLLITGVLLLLALAVFIVISEKNSESLRETVVQNDYTSISSEELENMLRSKDFVLIDVHTPEQEHIPGTDFVISYNKIDKIESELDSKDAKVVLYCRSGSMSKIAAQELIDRGYSNVYELIGGLHDWESRGRETIPKGSVTE